MHVVHIDQFDRWWGASHQIFVFQRIELSTQWHRSRQPQTAEKEEQYAAGHYEFIERFICSGREQNEFVWGNCEDAERLLDCETVDQLAAFVHRAEQEYDAAGSGRWGEQDLRSTLERCVQSHLITKNSHSEELSPFRPINYSFISKNYEFIQRIRNFRILI